VSLYQASILLQFNDRETLGLDALRNATEIPEQEFKRHLLSLCTPKLKILKKHSKGKVRTIATSWRAMLVCEFRTT
jgi:cullin 3